MVEKKRGLGRGLEALLGQSSARPAAATPEQPVPPVRAAGDELANLPLDLLQRGKYQPRLDMRPESLAELAVGGCGTRGRSRLLRRRRRWSRRRLAEQCLEPATQTALLFDHATPNPKG